MTDEMLYMRAAAALVFVLALLGVVAYVSRRFSSGPMALAKRQKRLAVVEVAAIDPKRRLVLVKRDQTEHLLLIGGGQDVVIERAIMPTPSQPLAADPEPTARPAPARSRLDEVRF